MLRKKYFLMDEAGQEGAGGGAGPTIEERLAAPAGTYDDEVIVDESGQQQQQNDNPPATYTANPIWNQFKDLEGFAMPENITEENEFELMKPFLEKKLNVQPKINLHPLAQTVQQLATQNPEMTLDELLGTINPLTIDPSKMSNDDLVRSNYIRQFGLYDETTNPDGLTEDDIRAEIENMTKINKLSIARAERETIISERENSLNAFQQQSENEFNNGIEAANKAIEESIPLLVAEVGKNTDIYGIKFSQPELTNYMEEYKEFLKPDPKTGLSKFGEWLSNDLNIFHTWLLQVKIGESNMKEVITEAREGSKKKIFESLRLTPTLAGGQGKPRDLTDPNDPDVKRRLNAPDGTFTD